MANTPNFPDKEKLAHLLSDATDKLNISENAMREALDNGAYEKLISKLRPADAQKVAELLSDEKAARRLLATPQAQALLKKLMNGE